MPTATPVPVSRVATSLSALAMPKSTTLTAPEAVSMTFAGLMSRCTMACRWLWSSAASTWPVMSTACATASGPSLSTWLRVRPATYSMTR